MAYTFSKDIVNNKYSSSVNIKASHTVTNPDLTTTTVVESVIQLNFDGNALVDSDLPAYVATILSTMNNANNYDEIPIIELYEDRIDLRYIKKVLSIARLTS